MLQCLRCWLVNLNYRPLLILWFDRQMWQGSVFFLLSPVCHTTSWLPPQALIRTCDLELCMWAQPPPSPTSLWCWLCSIVYLTRINLTLKLHRGISVSGQEQKHFHTVHIHISPPSPHSLLCIFYISLAGIPRPPHPSDISSYYPLSPGQIPHPLGWLVPQ